MRILFSNRIYLFGAIAVGILVFGFLGVRLWQENNAIPRETAKVMRGDVSVLVSVSGSIRTVNTARLGFARNGTVAEILVKEGDTVAEGQVLATLGQSTLISEYKSALTRLELAKAKRNEERTEAGTDIANAESALARVTREQDELVANARRTFLSEGLAATPNDRTNDDTPPTISGIYTCKGEGSYVIDIYRSNSESGYAFHLSGLESGGGPAFTGTAGPLGSCGLFIQFADGVAYGTQTWTVAVPNTRSATYVSNLNAYNLALEKRKLAIEAAEEGLATVETRAINGGNATEASRRAEAEVRQAEADVKAAEAKIADDTIRAPFSGIISSVDISLGEVSSVEDGIVMTANDSYELKVRIPEIDITHIEAGDTAIASFDAKPEERIPATVSFVSPLPTEIDGVAYFEALLTLVDVPPWMRTGLNADVDITIDTAKEVLIIPKRFIKEDGGKSQVLMQENGNEVFRDVTLGLIGNDGIVEISGIAEGTELIAP